MTGESPDRADAFLLGQVEIASGRYVAPDPVTGRETRWTRVTTQAALLQGAFGLTRYQLRQLLLGLRQRPDLWDRLAATVDPTATVLDEIITSAHGAAGTDAAAHRGTAVHEVLLARDLGQTYPPQFAQHVASYGAELARHGLTVIEAERLVLCRSVGTVGRRDRLYRESDGSVVVGDIKTTGHADLAAPDMAVQLGQYALAEYVWDDVARSWVPAPVGVRTDRAVIVLVDAETGATSVYRLDIEAGRRALNLSVQVREWRRAKGLLLPYVPPVTATAGQVVTVPTATAGQVVTAADVRAGVVVTEAEVRASLENLTGVSSPPAPSEPVYTVQPASVVDPETQIEELAKLPKAKLQTLCREAGITDLAHQRKHLARALVERRLGAAAPAEAPVAPVDQRAAASDDAFARLRVGRVRKAGSVAELASIRSEVVRVDGDQGWTDELAEAARARAAELGEPVGTGGAAAAPHSTAVAQVQAAQTSADLARLWETWTVGGSAPERWSPEVDAAARARLAEIRAATPPPPANPFEGS